jgi:hypothetical protein
MGLTGLLAGLEGLLLHWQGLIVCTSAAVGIANWSHTAAGSTWLTIKHHTQTTQRKAPTEQSDDQRRSSADRVTVHLPSTASFDGLFEGERTYLM